MATSVLLACGLNEQQLPKFTFLREDTDVDGSFLVTCIVGQRLKIQSSGTILVCLHHTKEHYSNAGIRLGFNLNSAIDKGNLVVIEPLSDLAEHLFDSPYLSASQENILNYMWSTIDVQINALLAKKTSLTLVIDDISALVNIGATENLVVRFCRRLLQLTDGIRNLSICVKLNTSPLYEYLANNLEDMADTEIQIVKLKSGNFKEVDGKLISIKRDAITTLPILKSMLFKVNERNVKIFAPGEVGIKI